MVVKKQTKKKTVRKKQVVKKEIKSTQKPKAKKTNTDNNMLTAIFSYLGILIIIPLLIIKKGERTEFQRFHMEQGLNLFIVEIIAYIGLLIITIILAFIPVIGLLLSSILSLVFWLGFLIIVIMAIIKAVNNEKWKIPYLPKIIKL